MTKNNKKHKFTNSLTFKILCGAVVLFVLGLLYNLVIAGNDEVTEEQVQEEQQRNATLDTLDVIGDYLWPNQKPRGEDLLTDKEKAKQAEEAKKAAEEAKKKSTNVAEKQSNDINIEKDAAIPLPAPAADPVSKTESKATSNPTIEKVSTPKIEQIEQ